MKAKLHVSPDPEKKYPIYDVGGGSVEKSKSSSLTKIHSSPSTLSKWINDVRDGELNVPPPKKGRGKDNNSPTLLIQIDSEYDTEEIEASSSTSKSSNIRKSSYPRDTTKPIAINEDDSVTSTATRKKKEAKGATSKSKPAKKARAAKKTAPKKKVDLSESEDEFEGMEFDEDDNQSEKHATPPPRARSGRARKQITYAIEDSSDDQSSDGSSDW